jgi:hypothetical protein
MPKLSTRPTYSTAAINKYLQHISLPRAHEKPLLQNLGSKGWATSIEGLHSLSALQKYQQAEIPFALHYSKHHVVHSTLFNSIHIL